MGMELSTPHRRPAVVLIVILLTLGLLTFRAEFASAQQNTGSGPAPGTAARGSNPDNTSGNPDLITISASGCTVDEGASVTLQDGDGTEARFVDGSSNIQITATSSDIRIAGPNDDFIGDHAEFSTSDRSFDTNGVYTVVTTTGISCQGQGPTTNRNTQRQPTERTTTRGNADDQYGKKVVVDTIPDKKKLSKTGGPPVFATLLAVGFLGTGILLLRRT
jgi:hypothetical protein